MKKLIFTSLFLMSFFFVHAQGNRVDILKDLEKNSHSPQDQHVTATLKSASRLFASKDDLTSVILIVPSDSIVNVLEIDSMYLKVTFEDNEGYIFKRDAKLNNVPVEITPSNQQPNQRQVEQPVEQGQVSRFTFLENKYGSNMATRLAAGKIWKGMSGEMVIDSWGQPIKINRVIGNVVKEEWIYRNTWLYIENDSLVEWGPINR
jgi:hypothetical protein